MDIKHIRLRKLIVLSATSVLIWLTTTVIQNARYAWLISGKGYPLVNGYKYAAFDNRNLLERDGGLSIELGYFLNRIYIDDRFILGEVLKEPTGKISLPQYSYFILDTTSSVHRSPKYQLNLSKEEFEVELRKIGIWEEVRLVDRNHRKWLKKQ